MTAGLVLTRSDSASSYRTAFSYALSTGVSTAQQFSPDRFTGGPTGRVLILGAFRTGVTAGRASPLSARMGIRTTRGQPASRKRERELAWRKANAHILRRYAGRWVVLEGAEIVAHAERLTDAVAEARRRGVQVPYVFYMEPTLPPGRSARIGL